MKPHCHEPSTISDFSLPSELLEICILISELNLLPHLASILGSREGIQLIYDWSAKIVASDHGSEVFYTVLECLSNVCIIFYCEIFACRFTTTVPGHWQLQHPPAIVQLQVDIGRLV